MVTHRIIGIDEEAQQLHTQGDANETEDAAPVAFTNVVGKVFFHLPLLGYPVSYTHLDVYKRQDLQRTDIIWLSV